MPDSLHTARTEIPTDRFVTLAIGRRSATITLSRPKLNPINDDLLNQLDEALAELESHPELSVVRIRSDQRAFSAGADLEIVQARLGTDAGAQEMMETSRRFHRVYDRLASLPAVTIAQIGGHAMGGGLELALACDLRIAARQAKLGLPETRVGLLPGAGGTQRLTQLCGPGIAARLILTCELVDGAEAHRIGLVQWVYDAAELDAATDALVSAISTLSAPALLHAKQCIGHATAMSAAGVRAEVEGIGELMKTEEARQLIGGFLGKQRPAARDRSPSDAPTGDMARE